MPRSDCFNSERVVFMNKFTSGLIAGGIIGAAGFAVAMSDKRSRRHVMREGRKAMKKAGHMVENVTDMF